MGDEWKESFENIKERHYEAFQTLELAGSFIERGHPEVALINYKIGLRLIDEALATPVALPDDPSEVDETWNEALAMIQKMKRARAEVFQHIVDLSAATSKEEPDGDDFETIDEEDSGRPRTYNELAAALRTMESPVGELPSTMELLFSCENVKLYHIAATGVVTTADEDSTFRIVCLGQDVEKGLKATCFWQIIKSSIATEIQNEPVKPAGEELEEAAESLKPAEVTSPQRKISFGDESLIYPLVPGASPCFRTDYGAFIFPDLEATSPGSAIGIVIPEGPSEIVLEILEAILHGVVKQSAETEEDEELQLRTRRAAPSTSTTISNNIVQGAFYISQGLVKGSEKVGEFVNYSTPYIMSKLNKAPENTPPVPNKVIGGIEIAKTATSMAANATGYVAGKVGSATIALGRFLAPHVQAQGSKLLSSTMGITNDEAAEKMGGALTIAAGAVEGFGTVYTGLEKSSKILGKNLSNNSVKIIEHKYGPSAGTVAAGTFDTVGNMINFSHNVNYMNPKGLAKKTVKNAGKAMIADFRPKNDVNYVTAGSLYPDLTEFTKEISKPKF